MAPRWRHVASHRSLIAAESVQLTIDGHLGCVGHSDRAHRPSSGRHQLHSRRRTADPPRGCAAEWPASPCPARRSAGLPPCRAPGCRCCRACSVRRRIAGPVLSRPASVRATGRLRPGRSARGGWLRVGLMGAVDHLPDRPRCCRSMIPRSSNRRRRLSEFAEAGGARLELLDGRSTVRPRCGPGRWPCRRRVVGRRGLPAVGGWPPGRGVRRSWWRCPGVAAASRTWSRPGPSSQGYRVRAGRREARRSAVREV